jgi:hypothetical protein
MSTESDAVGVQATPAVFVQLAVSFHDPPDTGPRHVTVSANKGPGNATAAKTAAAATSAALAMAESVLFFI